MKKIFLLHILFLTLCNSLSAQVSIADTGYVIRGKEWRERSENIPLDEPWKYKLGDSAVWSKPEYADTHWQRVRTPKMDSVFKATGSKARHIGWLRTSFYLDAAVIQKPIAISIVNNGAMRVFLDGDTIATYGTFDHNGKHSYLDQDFPIMVNIKNPGNHILAVQYENEDIFDDFKGDGFKLSLRSAETGIFNIWLTLWLSSLALLPAGFVFLALFLSHLLFFLYYNKDKSNLYFSLFNLGMGLIMVFTFTIFNSGTPDLKATAFYAIIMATILAAFALSAFINHLFGSFGWRFKLVIVLCLVCIAGLFLFGDSDLFGYMPLLLFILVAAEAVVLMIRALVRKVRGARILGAGILFFFAAILILAIIITITGGFNIDGNSTWTIITVIIFMALILFSIPVSISAYLAWKFANANKDLQTQIVATEALSQEKQIILENQKEELEKEVVNRTREVVQQKQQIELEKKKSDDLLLNILPAEVAEELKENGSTKAKYFDHVSVLFTDFVNFTHIAEQLSPEQLVQELHECFRAFDEITERNGMEKIKTIGDAYLAVSGMPLNDERHAYHAVKAGLEIAAFIQNRQGREQAFEVRIGINSGSLVAGIVGVKKFAYDIWGDTVNMASRMESNSESGKVNISGSTYELVKDDFKFNYRGKINAKNKGDVDMYFVHF